jgi:hypothetical protein
MASRGHFQQELNAQIERAIERGAEQLIVNSGELLAAVGGRPVLKNQMRYCCDVMREEMKAGDAGKRTWSGGVAMSETAANFGNRSTSSQNKSRWEAALQFKPHDRNQTKRNVGFSFRR